MGVYIKGMKMPKHNPAWVVIHHDGTIEVNDGSGWWTTIKDGAIEVKAPPSKRRKKMAEKDWCEKCIYKPCNKTGLDKDYCLIRYLIWEAHNCGAKMEAQDG